MSTWARSEITPFGLFDDYPAVTSVLELARLGLGIPDDLTLQDGDAGHVSECLTEEEIGGFRRSGRDSEQVERPDGPLAEPQGQRTHGTEPGRNRLGNKLRPAFGGGC